MVKEKKILLYFISFIIGLLTIMLIGISDVFALTNKTIYSGVNSSGLTGNGYYNYGYINAGGVQNTTTGFVGSTINGVSYGFQFYYYEDIILNNTYSLKINFKSNDLLKSVNSNNFDIKTCTNDNCSNAIIISLEKENQNSNSSWVIVKFNPVDRGNIVSVDIGSDSNQAITGVDNFGISSIQTEYSNSNQDIIDNDKENTNNIIDNNNNNTQNIIDNVNGTIKDTFEECRDSVNIAYNVQYSETGNDWWSIVNVIQTDIKQGETYTISVDIDAASNTIAYWNNSDGVFNTSEFNVKKGLNRYSYTFVALKDATSISQTLTKYGNGDGVLISSSKLQIQKGSVATAYEEPNKQVCINKIDETNDKLDETNQNLNDIEGALTDSSAPNTSGLENSAGWLPAGPLDSVLNLPLSLFNALTTNLNKSCNPINIPLPYVNKNITLPCINTLYNQIGITSFLSWIGVIVSGLMLYTYLLKLYKWIEDRISLNETHNVDSWGGL